MRRTWPFSATAVKFIEGGYKLRGRTIVNEDQLFQIMEEKYIPAAYRIYEMINQLEFAKKLTGRLPCSLLLTLYTYFSKKEWDKIDEFIYGCASNIGLQKGDPRRLVYAMYAKYHRMGGTFYRPQISKKDEMGILLGSWKHWYDDTVHLRQFTDAEIGKVLAEYPNVAGTDVSYAIN